MSIKDELIRRLEARDQDRDQRKATLDAQQDAMRRQAEQHQELMRELGRNLGIEGVVKEAYAVLKERVPDARYSDGASADGMNYEIAFSGQRGVHVSVTPQGVAVSNIYSGLRTRHETLEVSANFDLAVFDRVLADALLLALP